MSDLIDRQPAIDAMNEVYCHVEMIKKRPVNKTEQAMYLDMIGALKSVPSAQPEPYSGFDMKGMENDQSNSMGSGSIHNTNRNNNPTLSNT